MNNDTTVMQWQPALIRLNSAPHPDLDNGKSFPVFIAPQYIVGIEIQKFSYNKADKPEERHPQQIATRVVIGPQHYYFVVESPEIVALMRDRALGHAPQLDAA